MIVEAVAVDPVTADPKAADWVVGRGAVEPVTG